MYNVFVKYTTLRVWSLVLYMSFHVHNTRLGLGG